MLSNRASDYQRYKLNASAEHENENIRSVDRIPENCNQRLAQSMMHHAEGNRKVIIVMKSESS